jgi:3-dehydro-L-gulonate 2-dehydrogenase
MTKPDETMTLVPPAEMREMFYSILLKNGFTNNKAHRCAEIFTDSSIDGVYTHGVNRFSIFINYIKKGYVHPDAEPILKNKLGNIEQWDGNLGPGPLNAMVATDRAIQLAKDSGIGCVALSNTNHWMRGGTYGWHAAGKGCVFIGFSNTIANMPAWGATDKRLGNNPLVLAIPYKEEAIVLDMAMSQYSFGAMELAKMKNENLETYGGYDKEGKLTRDPGAIIESRRTLPVGYWKGAGLALLLDILAAALSGGLATHEISKQAVEYGLSQVFIAIDISKLARGSSITTIVDNIIDDYHQSIAIEVGKKMIYPGERVMKAREQNLQHGIPVVKRVWEEIMKL